MALRTRVETGTLACVILSDEICKVLSGGVSIVLASRNAALEPSIARGAACRVLDGARLRIVLSVTHAGRLLDDVRESGMVSATFVVPDTHRALQFKAPDARIEPLDAHDRAALEAHIPAFAACIDPLGFREPFVRAFFASPGDEVAIEFTPAEAFQQTPGPAAGKRIA